MRDPYLFSPKNHQEKEENITEKHTTNFAHFSCHDERRLRHIFESSREMTDRHENS